jgi:SNF2 family DNA or RNA helicase
MVEVELSEDTYALYAALQLDFVAEVEGGVVTASNALTKLLRLQQITGGVAAAETLEGDIIPQRVGEEKLEALSAILDGTDEPVVVFTRFVADLEGVRALCEKNGWSFSELSGNKNELADWQAGKGRVLGVQIQAGGVGVDLTRARYCVYYSVNWSLGDYEQSLARVHRPGQTKNVVYYHLIAKDTVDQQVYGALKQKRDIVETVIEQMRAVRGQRAS